MLFYFCLSIVALTLVGLVAMIRAAFAAPYAVEDEKGFRFVGVTDEPSAPAVPAMQVATPDLAFFHR